MSKHPFGPWATALSAPGEARLSTFWTRRMAMLPQLGRGLPALSRRGRCGLLMLAMIALAMPSLRGTSAAPRDGGHREVSQDAAKGPPKVDDEERALKEFLEAYRLEPGQILKRLSLPRPEGVRIWWKQKYPNQVNYPDQFGAMVFRWREPDQLDNWGGVVGGNGLVLRSLLSSLDRDIYSVEIEGDRKLLETVVTGDWIYRDGVDDERMVSSLESILQRTLRLRIAMTFRQVERDVVVARGQYRSSPVTGRPKNNVEIYAKQIVKNGGGAGGGTGKFSMFLKWVGQWIERPVVNEVETPPKEELSWFYNSRSPFNEQMKREDHDEALVFQHLQEQTGLTFTRERRTIRILFIERAN
jgi:Protein of unknown function (DUF3738)